MLVELLSRRMTLVWLVYLLFAELLSLLPSSQPSSCILISQEAKAENYSGDYACASMHEAIFRFASFIWDNASHDNVVAFGTILIAVFTFVLYRSTEKLWSAGKDQIELAREEFISSHRPRLRIRSIDRATSNPTDYIGVKFAVVNIGDTEAHLLGARVLVDFFQEKPPIDINGVDVIQPRRFLPGASDSYTATSSRKWLILNTEYNASRYLFVHGQIVYRNALGTTYTTSFCRIWNIAANRFKRTDDPDYEYED